MIYEAGSDAVVYAQPRKGGEDLSPEEQEALDLISQSVHAGKSIDDIIDSVWNATTGVVPRDRIGLSFIDEDGVRVSARYMKSDYEDVKLGAGYSAPLAGSSLKGLMETGGVRIIPDMDFYLAAHPDSESTRLIVAEGIKTSITLPLRVGEREVGFLFFSSRRPRVYDEGHARFLLEAAERISQAVEKAWIIKRLEDANRSYTEMLGFVAHELKAPLASIMTKGGTYLEGYFGKVDRKAAEVVRSVVQSAGYLTDMVNNYIDLSRLESGGMRYEPQQDLRVRRIVGFAVESVSTHAARRNTSLRVDAPEQEVLITADPQLLATSLVNLLDNAVKYGRGGEEVRLSLSVEEGRLTVKVRNQGVGFSKKEARGLFKKFSRLQQRGLEDRKGSGLGLYLVAWIADRHKGRLSADSEPGKWAEFTLRLPGARLVKKALGGEDDHRLSWSTADDSEAEEAPR